MEPFEPFDISFPESNIDDDTHIETEDEFRQRLHGIARLSMQLVAGTYRGKIIYFDGRREKCLKKVLLHGIL